MRNWKFEKLVLGFGLAIGLLGCNSDTPGPMQTTQLSSGYHALQQGNAQLAIDRADAYLLKQPHGAGSAEAYYLKGRGYELKTAANPADIQRNLTEARTAYSDAMNENPSSELEGDIRAGLSNVAFFQDDYPIAFAEASKAYRLSPSPETQSVLLYRMGLSQERMGRFTDADATFALVEQRYPGSPTAQRAHEHEGVRNFYVQIATYNTAAGADRAIASLKTTGLVLSKRADANGRTMVDAGPFGTYDSAKETKQRLAGQFPDALIKP